MTVFGGVEQCPLSAPKARNDRIVHGESKGGPERQGQGLTDSELVWGWSP